MVEKPEMVCPDWSALKPPLNSSSPEIVASPVMLTPFPVTTNLFVVPILLTISSDDE